MKHLDIGIFTIENVLSPDECSKYIALTECSGYQAATITTFSGAAEFQPGIRNNDRVIVDDTELAEDLWLRVSQDVPRIWRGCQTIGLNERFRFYRYEPGQQFRLHVDGAFRRSNGEESQITMLVYLNDDFEGGETRFQDVDVKPQMGMALFFDHRLLHEGSEVLSGKKYVLRTDVMCAPRGQMRG